MTRAWTDQVHDQIEVPEDELCHHDQESLEGDWVVRSQ